ncbi:conserved hypothetical protein [Nostocoides japonicum T1-X7]|uniref:Uncharacterized protein n=1 Tax=Nostocoides japonicum T1-X7 TaxID=1194083 RepID=A0A077M5G4_9MICO|nr:hypothetical protein [Tetrasphaera japonica]CCH79300.1 conserved hypothetical protein [Tetrasphaera japonica T1-X7]CCH79405.1 conserved hypothetical protein [Tetrasphaera japonica T1-X7]
MTTHTTHPTPSRAAVSVQELKRAWRSVEAGDFRPRQRPGAGNGHETTPHGWHPDEPVLPVVGCAGSVGATTLALALATRAPGATRIVECCTATASGLAPASTAELGQHPTGWSQGTRGDVLLERGSDILVSTDEVPTPTDPAAALTLTVLDVGWELEQVLASPNWLADQLLHSEHVVVATTATIPGLRRLEGALSLLAGRRVLGAVLGPTRRKWPRGLEHSLGTLTRQLDQRGDLHQIPVDRALAVRGLDSEALPTPLLTAADQVLRATVAAETTKGSPS